MPEIEALIAAGFLKDKALSRCNTAAGDAWPVEKNPNEIPMFAHFCERGLALPTSEFF